MSELIHLQNKFQAYLMHSDQSIYTDIISTLKVTSETRLAIYGNAYRSRLVDALASNYPILQIYLGFEQFEELSYAYIAAYPSMYRSIRWFGDKLNDFLKENTKYQVFPYLSELATLEWTMTLVFDAADSPLISIEDIVKHVPPETWGDMRLFPHPSTYLLNFSWNVVPLWKSISDEETPADPIQHKESISWLFWRKNLVNQYCSLPSDEAYALNAFLQGLTFGEICEGLCQWVSEQDAAVRAASLLKGWIASGLIAEVKT